MKALIALNDFFRSHPLAREQRLRAWARFIRWQLRSRLTDEVAFEWIAGQKLLVRHGMHGATGNIYVGLHEFPDMMMVLHFLREGDLFVDVGANVGTYTVLASGVCRAKSWAFEPAPDTARHLRRNVEANGLQDLVVVHEAAVGPAESEVAFTVGLGTMNKVVNDSGAECRAVHQTTLDALIKDHNPCMLKIDVEGYEEEALAGAKGTLRKPSLNVIELETVTPTVEHDLKANGFNRAYYEPFSRKLNRLPGGTKSSNALFVRDWDYVQRRLAKSRSISVLGRMI